MKMKQMIVGLAAFATLGTSSALAAPPDIAARQADVKQALSVFKLGATRDVVSESRHGPDLTLHTNANHTELLRSLQNAYLNETPLPNGYTIAGWAHIDATNSHTFTLLNAAGDRMVADVKGDAANNAEITVRGIVHRAVPTRKPLNEVPRRFVR